MARDRSQQTRGVHVDEIIGTKTIKKRLDALEDATGDSTPTNTTLTGVPQPGTPYLVANRVGDDGKIYSTVRFTSIPSLGRRFWSTHRLVKSDGSYGEAVRRAHKITAAWIAANSAEIQIDHGWHPNRRVDLVHVEVKLTDDATNDGGNYDENPKPYNETSFPVSPLANFTTGAAQTDRQQINEALNSKLKFGQAVWGDIAGAGTHDDHRLARWRYGFLGLSGWNVDSSIGDQTISTATNYWSSAVHTNPGSLVSVLAGVMVIRSASQNLDPCVKLHQDPFDPGEPVVVQFSMFKPLARGSFPTSSITVSVEDGGTNQVLCSETISLSAIAGVSVPTTSWFDVRTSRMTIRNDYTPVAGAGQVLRFHIDQDAQNGILMIDKVMASNVEGAYSTNPRDRVVDGAPTVPSRGDSSGRGAAGYGTTGGGSPVGGQILRPSSN